MQLWLANGSNSLCVNYLVPDKLIEQIEEMGDHVSFAKDKGEWHIHTNEWSVSNHSFAMAICQAYMKFKENKK